MTTLPQSAINNQQFESEHTSGLYTKRPMTIVRGQGATLWDSEGKAYIDCVGGQGAGNLGHANPAVTKAIAEQAGTVISVPEMFYNDKRAALMEKRFGIASWAVDNRATVMVLSILIALVGWNAYTSMPREAFPEVVTPEIFVSTMYPGNAPDDMEKLITRPLEKEIKTITGIDEILSTSVQGFSTIHIKFDFNVKPSEALRKVKDAVDKAKADPDFPTDLPAEPSVFEMNFSEMMPVMNLNLSGDYSIDQLNKWAEQLEDKLEDLETVNKVEIRGVPKKELRISLDLPKMEARELSFQDVASACLLYTSDAADE